jgi:hypothetical protein
MPTSRLLLLAAALMLLLSCPALAVQLREGHPNEVIVTRGDTLWDISGRFLQHPWEWPKLWKSNPAISNPHLIYPGDRLRLSWVNGEPRLVRHRGTQGSSPIGTVSLRELRVFLSRPYLLDDAAIENSAYIIGFREGTLIAGPGERAYARHLGGYYTTDESPSSTTWRAPDGYAPGARGEDELPRGFSIVKGGNTRTGIYRPPASHYDIVRPGALYRDYETGEVLGRVAIHVGSAELVRDGDPATLEITATTMEVMQGDRLIPATPAHDPGNLYFHPGQPSRVVDGHIIDVPGGVNVGGTYNVVAIDRGAVDGLEQGDVLLINTNAREVVDRFESRSYEESGLPRDRSTWGAPRVLLPEESAGHVIIFRVFERVSFGLVSSSTRSIKTGFPVHSP